MLRRFFPEDESEFAYLVPEVNNARVWAGVHFRNDMLVANVIGREAAAAVLEKCILTVHR